MSPSEEHRESSGSAADEPWGLIEKEIDRVLGAEPIRDQQYRAMIFAAQIGDLFKALTHDPAINPQARPVGDELSFAGDTLIQLLIYLRARGFSLRDAYSRGLERMREQVWRRNPLSNSAPGQTVLVELPPGVLATGETAVPGKASGRLVVIRPGWASGKVTRTLRDLGKEGGLIVAMEDYPPDVWDSVRNNFEWVRGLVLRNAGTTSHPANVCRDQRKPCMINVQGFENLTTGDSIELLAPENEPAVIRRPKDAGPKTLATFGI